VRRVPPKRLADQDAFALVTRITGVVLKEALPQTGSLA